MAKYYVTVESHASTGAFGAFGGIIAYSNKFFEVTLEPETPVNAKRFYDIINKDIDDEFKKTGNIIAWSKIEE